MVLMFWGNCLQWKQKAAVKIIWLERSWKLSLASSFSFKLWILQICLTSKHPYAGLLQVRVRCSSFDFTHYFNFIKYLYSGQVLILGSWKVLCLSEQSQKQIEQIKEYWNKAKNHELVRIKTFFKLQATINKSTSSGRHNQYTQFRYLQHNFALIITQTFIFKRLLHF